MLKNYLKTKKILAERILLENLVSVNAKPKNIHKAMKYSVLNGGKRLRPILVFLGNQLFNGNEPDCYPCASAVEFIHCYSLVHDDLPALDNDNYRRGKLTCHKKFSEELAILTGDALLTKAFEILATGIKDPKILQKIIAEIAKAIGSQGMIGGQVIDLECENINLNKNITKKQKINLLKYIHKNKTSKLIESSLVLGALTAKANNKNIENLKNYGECLGLMFQLTDDILDIIADKKKLGKSGSDIDNGKLTYPSIFGIQKSQEFVKQLKEKGIKELAKIKTKNKKAEQILIELLEYVENRSY